MKWINIICHMFPFVTKGYAVKHPGFSVHLHPRFTIVFSLHQTVISFHRTNFITKELSCEFVKQC